MFDLEDFHAVTMFAQLYYIFPGIQKPKKQSISIDKVEFIIANTHKFLVVTTTGL